MIEIQNILEKLNTINEMVNSLYCELFKLLANNSQYTDDIIKLKDLFKDKMNKEMLDSYVKSKTKIIKNIISNEVKKDDVIPCEPSTTKEELLNANDYSELNNIYKKYLSEIKSDKTLETIYLYKKDELLYIRAKEVIMTSGLHDLESKWIKIYSTITKKEYLDDLKLLYESRVNSAPK